MVKYIRGALLSHIRLKVASLGVLMPGSQDKFTQEVIDLQDRFSAGQITKGDFEKQLAQLKAKYQGPKKEATKFKVVTEDEAAKEAPKPKVVVMEKESVEEVKEAKVIATRKDYSRQSVYSINDIEKRIDRLDSERVSRLRDRYKEKYGEDLYVPDLHSDKVRDELEDVKPYLDIEESDVSVVKEDEKTPEEKKPEGPGFFAKLIASIKSFFKNLFSKKHEDPKPEATVTAAEGD